VEGVCGDLLRHEHCPRGELCRVRIIMVAGPPSRLGGSRCSHSRPWVLATRVFPSWREWRRPFITTARVGKWHTCRFPSAGTDHPHTGIGNCRRDASHRSRCQRKKLQCLEPLGCPGYKRACTPI
jgi:hypothetical protein